MYVERRLVYATGFPLTRARAVTIPSWVRCAVRVSLPGGVWSAALGTQLLLRTRLSIFRHLPRYR